MPCVLHKSVALFMRHFFGHCPPTSSLKECWKHLQWFWVWSVFQNNIALFAQRVEGECANLRGFCQSVPRLLARIVVLNVRLIYHLFDVLYVWFRLPELRDVFVVNKSSRQFRLVLRICGLGAFSKWISINIPSEILAGTHWQLRFIHYQLIEEPLRLRIWWAPDVKMRDKRWRI